MKGKIALEEHFATEEYLGDVKRFFIREGEDVWQRAKGIMCDISGRRLELMDEAGIEKDDSFSFFSDNSGDPGYERSSGFR